MIRRRPRIDPWPAQGNILITNDGTACLGDFGITGIVNNCTAAERGSAAASKSGVTRYMAPEVLNPPQFGLTQSSPSRESDVYSFAMTAYEVFDSYFVACVVDKPPSVLKGPLRRLALWFNPGGDCHRPQHRVREAATSSK